MSLLVSDEPLATRLMCSRSRGEREGGPAHVTSALLALLIGERHEAEMALLRARSETHAAIECLIEVAWAFLLIETGHPWRGAVHAASARQSEGFSADGGDDFLLRILEAQSQGHAPDAEHARLQLAAKTRQAIPDGTRHAALRAYASLVAAALAFDAGDADAAEAELAAGDTRPTGSSGLLGARADLLQARIAFARGNADEQAIRDLARAIDRLALLGAQRDLGVAYRVRATCGTRDASERAAWFARAQPLLARAGRPDLDEQLVLALEHSLVDRTSVGQLASATHDIASITELPDVIAAIPRLALVVCPATAAELLQVEEDEPPRVLSRHGIALSATLDSVVTALRSALAGESATERGDRSLAVRPLAEAGPGIALLVERSAPAGPLSTRDLEQLAVYASLAGSSLGRARATTALRETAARDAATLSAIQDGVVALDSQGLVVSVNEAASSALAIRREDLLGHRLTGFPPLVPLCHFLAGASGPGTGIVSLPQGNAVVRYLVHEGGAVLTIREPPDRAMDRRPLGAAPRFTFEHLVGRDPTFLEVLDDARKAATADLPIVITGESGTGKEMLAQAIHNASGRAGAPFLAINVTAIPRELLESELFGHEGGPFTGGRTDGQAGKFELAGRGTLVIDEIGDMPLDTQDKLLRVLQEGTVQRLGSGRETPVQARVIATTRRELERAVREGNFRLDLHDRLGVVHLRLPPLRERVGDVAAIVEHQLGEHGRRTGRKLSVAPAVMAALERYEWPGNVRELVNVLEGELALLPSGGDTISRVPRAVLRPLVARPRTPAGPTEILTLSELERRACEDAIVRFGGNVAYAARALGVARGTLYAKLKRYGIPVPESTPTSVTVPRRDPPSQ